MLGFITIPLVVWDKEIVSHFVVAQDNFRVDKSVDRKFLVIIGCNILYELNDIAPPLHVGTPDEESWNLVFSSLRIANSGFHHTLSSSP